MSTILLSANEWFYVILNLAIITLIGQIKQLKFKFNL